MHERIERISSTLAEDLSVSDTEIVTLAATIQAALKGASVVDLDRYKVLRVLEACAGRRGLKFPVGDGSSMNDRLACEPKCRGGYRQGPPHSA